MEIGRSKSRTTLVSQDKTAQALGSGDLPVYGTPAMAALMEEAAAACVADALEPGQTTVGTRMDVSHSSATPLGMQVTAYAKLTKAEGRILYFQVRAEDEAGVIGEGIHQRVIVNARQFLDRAGEKQPK